MKRRTFIAGFAGAVVLPAAAAAQQTEPTRSIGVLMSLSENDVEGQNRVAAFVTGLQKLGWTLGHNLRIDYRWTAGRSEELRMSAEDLVKRRSDLILAAGSAAVVAVMQVSRAVPVLFVDVADPIDAGFVATLMRPGGNATGFARADMTASGQWLELLRQIATGVKRVAVLRDPTATAGQAQLAAIRSTAKALDIVVSEIDVRNRTGLEGAFAAFARTPGGVLVVPESTAAAQYRDLIIRLAATYKLPAVYSERLYPAAGGLLSIGPDLNEEYRMAAEYADRILKGEKPAEMPVRAAAKIKFIINRKTARALGLVLTPALIARADEVIE